MRKKKCRECKEPYQPTQFAQVVCTPLCAAKYAAKQRQKATQKRERKEHREAKERLKNLSDWIKETQAVFNKYIRERDRGQPCISCGKYEHELKINHVISMVCGHYLSVGAHYELRFEPLNAHLQCTRCNGGAGKYGNFNNKQQTVTQQYRERLIDKIGLDKVEWLEGPHEPANWTIEEIKEIKETYKRKVKEVSND